MHSKNERVLWSSPSPKPFSLGRGRRSGPQDSAFNGDLQDKYKYGHTTGIGTDAVFFLMKVPEAQVKVLLGWIGYNMMLNQNTIQPPTDVGYLPVTDASLTELNTVHTPSRAAPLLLLTA